MVFGIKRLLSRFATLPAGIVVLFATTSSVYAWQIESQNITVASTFGGGGFTTINFRQTYATPPIVVATASNQGGDPSDLFITNVSTTGFQVAPVEPNANDGPHIAMNVAYVAVEPGTHTLPDGSLLEAGTINTTSVQHGVGVTGATAWTTVNFGSAFSAAPALVANIQSHNNESANPPGTSSRPFISVAVNNVNASSVDLAIERSESGSGSITLNETIGYIAVENGASGSLLDNAATLLQYEAFTAPNPIRGWSNGCFNQPFGNTYSSPPRVVATKTSRLESDGGWLRRCFLSNTQVGLEVDEDRDTNNERSHVGERGALLVFERDFDASLQPDLLLVKTGQTISDPYSTTNPKAIPGATVNYQFTITNQGDGAADNNSTLITDPIPVPASLVVTDIGAAGSGPVLFSEGSPPSSLTYSYVSLASTTDDLSFSNDNAASFNYTPTADANGVDSAVTHIRISFQGSFNGQTGSGATSAQLQFQIQVD